MRAKGLDREVPSLFDYPTRSNSGVDIALMDDFPIETGTNVRASIGLPTLSEPEVVRHYVNLSRKNYAIDYGIYPLGSCTMKHNPRLNEKLATLPTATDIHPLQPIETMQGTLGLLYQVEEWIRELTGFAAVSLQPAAGAHGEMAGMMVIKKALQIEGKDKNTILIPDSAHGTNPATASALGFQIRTIKSNIQGQIDLADFYQHLDDDVAGMMITNPNTAGIFEADIKEITQAIHQKGGYVYGDGANFNALVGKVKPADLGIDVMHLNLHKTFSTPHGGGGPGAGPIAVTKGLAPYLPIPRIKKQGNQYTLDIDYPESIGKVKAYLGHVGMMVRTLAYMLSHGKDGLRQVAEDAVLNANYIRSQLQEDFHLPFSAPSMHECLFTDKWQRDMSSTHDIGKALMEYGIHPMTVYFPLIVEGAMLIEPTETESKASIDQFIAVMKRIANMVKTGDAAQLKTLPLSTPRSRVDEVKAAKSLHVTAE